MTHCSMLAFCFYNGYYSGCPDIFNLAFILASCVNCELFLSSFILHAEFVVLVHLILSSSIIYGIIIFAISGQF